MRWLRDAGREARHVRDVGLAQAPDGDIIRHARKHHEVIVTQDTDYGDAAGGEPATWLQVVLVLLGNTSTARLLDVWAAQWSRVRAELEAGQEIVEAVDEEA